MGDTAKQSKLIRDALNTTHEILKYSPKRDSLFECLKQNIAPEKLGFRTLCSTRWAVRARVRSKISGMSVTQMTLILGREFSAFPLRWEHSITTQHNVSRLSLSLRIRNQLSICPFAHARTLHSMHITKSTLAYEILRHTGNLIAKPCN